MGAGPSAESLGGVDTGVASADGAQQAAQIQLSDEARSMFAQKVRQTAKPEIFFLAMFPHC